MHKSHEPFAQVTPRKAAQNWLAFTVMAVITAAMSPPAMAADPPQEIHITRQGTITPKDERSMAVRFEAELKLHPVSGGGLKGEGTFHCVIQDTDGGFVLEANEKFPAEGTWEKGQVRVSGPERLKYLCKKSHFDPANPGPNPEGAWKPGDTDTVGLAEEFFAFEGTLKDGRYEPPVQVLDNEDGVWRITTRMTAASGTPGEEDTDQTSDTTGTAEDGDNAWPPAGTDAIWTSDPKSRAVGFFDKETGHGYSLKYNFQWAISADGSVTARAFDIEAENYGANVEDIPGSPDDPPTNEHHKPYPLPIRFEWLSVQVKPVIELTHVTQDRV